MGSQSRPLGMPGMAELLLFLTHVSRVFSVDTPLDTIKHDLKAINANINTFKGKKTAKSLCFKVEPLVVYSIKRVGSTKCKLYPMINYLA